MAPRFLRTRRVRLFVATTIALALTVMAVLSAASALGVR